MGADNECDVVLIGAGIMSATLGTLLRKLEPSLRVDVFERLDGAAAESSDAWNNAGTGHAGYCQLNYTPARADGAVDCEKALRIAAQFGLSLELWRSLVASGDLPETPSFIRQVPHLSFVEGDDIRFLRARARQLAASRLFHDIEYSEDIWDWRKICISIVMLVFADSFLDSCWASLSSASFPR